MSNTSLAQLHPASAPHPHQRTALYVSVILWVATIAGNVPLFVLRPTGHWALLEILETLQVASLVPVAFILFDVNRRSALAIPVTGIGVSAMLAGMVIDLGFVTGAATYGQGLIGGAGFFAFEGAVLLWLLAANLLALRTRSLPRSVAVVGVATALTGTLLYPIWALRLAQALTSGRSSRA